MSDLNRAIEEVAADMHSKALPGSPELLSRAIADGVLRTAVALGWRLVAPGEADWSEVNRLRGAIDSILTDADRSYYERRQDDWWLHRLEQARSGS